MKNVNYSFSSKLVLSSFHATPLDNNIDDEALIRGHYNSIEKPLIFKQTQGKNLTDILDTGFISLYLISYRFKKLLEDNHITGWKTHLAKVYDKHDKEVLGYSILSITGRCDDIDYKQSLIIKKRLVNTGPLCSFYKGIVINGWDGSDFFSPNGSTHIFVTEKTAVVLKSNGISNLLLENLADYEVLVSSIDIAKG